MTQTTTAQPHHGDRPEIEHPLWCDPGSCCADTNGTGRHQSAAVELRAIPPNPLSVVARLSQGAPMPGYPLADISLVSAALSDDEGEIFDVMMYPQMARELGRVLTHTANLSDQ
jgi:hypothetical protein